jgi:hypothetical protein
MSRIAASLFHPASSGPAAPPAALEEAARALEVVSPSERRSVLRDEAALLLDGLLVRVARGRTALDVALCEGLGALSVGDRLLSLGWSGVGDYARERLGVAARTGQVMARLGRALAERPLLRAAVRSGEVSLRAAQEVARVAVGEEEAAWVERARALTVRGLVAAVREAQRGRECDAAGAEGPTDTLAGSVPACAAATAGEPWQRVRLEVTPAARDALEAALDLAGGVLGQSAPRWQRLEAVAHEYLGAHGSDEPDHEVVAATLAGWRGAALEDQAGRGQSAAAVVPGWRADLEAWLEAEHERWAFLERVEPVVAAPLDLEVHPARLDADLRELAALRERWDSLLGHLALLVRMLGLWRDMQFLSFSHYCKERLGLSVRSVEQRIALERRLHQLPELRAALAAGRLDAERARLVASAADEETEAGWIARAEGSTAVALRRAMDAEEAAEPVRRAEAAQVWAAAWARSPQGREAAAAAVSAGNQAQVCASADSPATPLLEFRLRVPVRVAELLASALRAAQRVPRPDGRVGWRTDSECLALVVGHFLATWAGLPRPRTTPQRRALARDGHRCQVPGCSRAAVHAHHVLYRSHGGDLGLPNLTSLCAAHHLHGVHRGFVRVRGLAPDRLVWELGERDGPRLGRQDSPLRE